MNNENSLTLEQFDKLPIVYFYGLCDPDTEEIRYIGKSIRPFQRAINHLNDRSRCHRTNWIQSLLSQGKEPKIKILGSIRGNVRWQEWEKWWIAVGKSRGWRLTNSTSGGDGVPDLPPEIRERIRQASIGRTQTSEQRAKILKSRAWWRPTQEHRERIKQANLGRKITWIDKVAAGLRKLSDEQIVEIERRFAAGEGTVKLAAEYGVHRTTMSKIKLGTYRTQKRGKQQELNFA